MRQKQPEGSDLIGARSITSSALILCFSLALHPAAAAQETAAGEPVAATDRFVFYSRFPFNLHDRLRHTAVVAEADSSACLLGLPEQDRHAWQRAVQQYREIFTARDGRLDALRVRLHLAGFGEQVGAELGPIPEEVQQALEAGAAGYRACWWRRDDEANRRWINALHAMLLEVGEEVASRLTEAYQTAWKAPRIPVDVVPYVSRTGANTASPPPHILINSSYEHYQGRAALEMIFHEASHTIIGPREGEPSRQFREAGERLSVEVPRDWWHVLLFYTTGEVVPKVIEEKYGEEYLPYVYAGGLFERGTWPAFQEPFETWWKPYLAGELQMPQAAEGVLRALSR